MEATLEVGSAILTAVLTTVISFLPVFSMIGQEGRLFRPLAFTKTFALVGSILVALLLIPPAALVLFPATGGALGRWWRRRLERWRGLRIGWPYLVNGLVMLLVASLLASHWEPLGPERGAVRNLAFVLLAIVGLLLVFTLLLRAYEPILRWCLAHKLLFLSIPACLCVLGVTIWLGVDRVFGFVPASLTRLGVDRSAVYSTTLWSRGRDVFPGLGKEFMPPLDEGSYLFMPTTMPHASIGEALDVLQRLDRAIESVPEVELAVGKIGRVESALDPAPVSMVETVVNYQSEFVTGPDGRRSKFRHDSASGEFVRDDAGRLIPDPDGLPYRNWRPEIRSPDDIWNEIVSAARLTGTVTAPELQPIAARIVMLASGMRAPMGVKVKGPSLEAIEEVGLQLEQLLKEVPSVEADATFADRVVGKPYIEIDVDRRAASRYGVSIAEVQNIIEIALGGRRITTTVEGRERYPVRVRYQRELRDTVEGMGKVLVPTPSGAQIPLEQLAEIRYARGPQVIKTEDTLLTSYVIFDKRPGWAEVDVVRQCQQHLEAKLASGRAGLARRGLLHVRGLLREPAARGPDPVRGPPAGAALDLPDPLPPVPRGLDDAHGLQRRVRRLVGRFPDALAVRHRVVPRLRALRGQHARSVPGAAPEPERRGLGRLPRALRDRDRRRRRDRDLPAPDPRRAPAEDRGGDPGRRGRGGQAARAAVPHDLGDHDPGAPAGPDLDGPWRGRDGPDGGALRSAG